MFMKSFGLVSVLITSFLKFPAISGQTEPSLNCTCQPHYPIGVDFREGGKPEYPEKNPRSTGEINYEELNSHETQTKTWLFQ